MREFWFMAAAGGGGAIGAIARYLISTAAHRQWGGGFPWGTLLANLLGCFAIGCVLTLAENSAWITPRVRAAVVTGFLGALTTFSTFGWETLAAARNAQVGIALVNVTAHVVLGLGAVWLGIVIGSRLVTA